MNKNYRIILLAEDASEYEHGDVTAEERCEIDARITREGVWGFIVQKRVTGCRLCGRPPEGEDIGEWADEDSCFGFIGTDIASNGMADHIALDGQRDVPVYDDSDVFEGSIPLTYYSGPARKRRAK